MFLSQFKDFVRSFRFRIAATYLVMVVIGAVVLFGFLYYLIEQTLKEKDNRIIESEFKRFSLISSKESAQGLERWFQQKRNSEDNTDVFVRLRARDGHTLFEHDPAILHELDEPTFRFAIDDAKVESHARVESSKDHEDAVEFYTGQLTTGETLQVGKDTDDREDLLEKFRNAFSITLLVTLVTAVLSGLFFSRAIVRPIRKLIETMNNVRKGDLAARATLRQSGDEVDELAKFLNAMLDQNSKLINALTDSLDAVAHDLRTPLTRLRANAEHALETANANPKQTEALGEVIENTDQVIELLNAIFDMAEANAGALKLKIQKFSACRLIEDIVDVYALIAEEKSIAIDVSVPADFNVYCDVRVKQVIANLVDNALKFSPLNSKVVIRAVHVDRETLIAVEDQGVGIAADETAKIWERLYRGDQSRSTRGMGLGLSLVRAIITAHGGEARVKPNTPRGSIFEITLPDLRA